ncbi:PSD1 and planctomycete cytochrome C domain-containing protein [Rubripirellula lacrimiformis]|nr:PSD1 and planctomycete cytochrome C domain-containing protein [Rubripirellula lacrimiformis]
MPSSTGFYASDPERSRLFESHPIQTQSHAGVDSPSTGIDRLLRGPFLALAFGALLATGLNAASAAPQDAVPQDAAPQDAVPGDQTTTPIKVSYNRDVRPILSQHCFQCHGPDEEARQADLRLDIAGDADLDSILDRIQSDDPDTQMPPPQANKPINLSKRQILESWVNDGAPYQTHWAFLPPTGTTIPEGVHPVDHFIDARLAQAGRTRSPMASAHARIRRVYLDLIGLPPTPEVADQFAANPTPESYTAIVDELLQSPRYGERWARRWLDLARYADTNGYEKDRDRSIWPYRDWVIRAFNADMPFDQFTIAQIAGDMLPNPTPDQLVATGFHRNTMLNEEGGIDPLEFRYHAMTDRVATTGTTWLGLTTGCAQCHTHKYDPITHHDYFGIMAYLNNADEPDYFLPIDEDESQRQARMAEADRLLDQLESHWPQPEPESEHPSAPETAATKTAGTKPAKTTAANAVRDIETAFTQWLANEQKNRTDWTTLIPESMSANVPYLSQESDGVIFAAGDTSKHDIYTFQFTAGDAAVHSIRLDAFPDDRLPGRGPGMTYYEGRKGDFYLTEFQLSDSQGEPIPIADASEDFAKNAFGKHPVSAKHAIDGDIQTGWSVAEVGAGLPHAAVFNLQQPIQAGQRFTLTMHFGRHFASSLGKFKISSTDNPEPIRASLLTMDSMSPELWTALTREDAADDPDVRRLFLMQAPEVKAYADTIRSLREPPHGTLTLVMRERPPESARTTFLHHRGEFTQPTEEVGPRLPEALLESTDTVPTNRLEFARWLVSPHNPLTARVVANRQWAAFFGVGIVSTTDDLGMQGESPSHPRLLDYLAVHFMENGWSIKNLHRLIVTSETYQQSAVTADADTADAVVRGDDRLLGRFPRRRLEAEIIRDASLAASGLLNDQMFGPPVRPPQPESAVSANYSKSKWTASPGADRFRRSVYTYQKRTAPFEMFMTFDGTSGESCVAKRDVSNTPLQALTLMNDPMFVEIAESYGKRMAAMQPDAETPPAQSIATGFRWLMTRPPTANELELLSQFHAQHGDWTATARVLLCIDEAINQN